jgi:hypothetical protein
MRIARILRIVPGFVALYIVLRIVDMVLSIIPATF